MGLLRGPKNDSDHVNEQHNRATTVCRPVITLTNFSHQLMHTAITLYLSTITSSKANKGKKGGWLPSGVVAQWQSTGSSSQRPWV